MASTAEPICNFCDKHGLLIMPVRYAIAPLELGLPLVAAPLKVEDAPHSVGNGKKQDLTLHGSVQYTTRVLRSGYLYVYDEKRDRMDAYWISKDGYFMRFPAETTITDQAKSAVPCHFAGHKELAGYIAISDAEQAGIVWLGFSDVQWTKAVMQAHRGAAGKGQRALHMRCFDAGAWAKAHKTQPRTQPGLPASPGRGSTAHAVNIAALGSTVAEYASANAAQSPSSKFVPPSSPDYRSRAGQADAWLDVCRRRSPRMQGAIVALDDPAGIAQDLAALIQWHQDMLLDTRVPKDKFAKGYGYATTYRHLKALEGEFASLKHACDEQVKLRVFQYSEQFAGIDAMLRNEARIREQLPPSMSNYPSVSRYRALAAPSTPSTGALFPAPTPTVIKTAQSRSWQDYMQRIRVDLLDVWKQQFTTACDTLHRQHISPLARAHASWMQSNLLANKLECAHDGEDVRSGDVYAQTLQLCMANTQQIGGCMDVYLRWLKGEIADRTNLLLRALVLRQNRLIDNLASAPLNAAGVPWGSLFETYTQHVSVLLKPGADAAYQAARAQAEAAKAKRSHDEAMRDYAQALSISPGLALTNNLFRRDVEASEAALKKSQARADEASRDAKSKLLPDSVSALLVQVAAPISAALREFNENAAEKTLARWMAIVGVALRTPAGVIEVAGKARDTIEYLSRTFMGNLVEAGEKSGKPLSTEQIRQLTAYAERQVAGSFSTGNIGEFRVLSAKGEVRSKLAVFITEDMHEKLAQIKDPTQKVAWLAKNVTTPRTLYEYGVLRIRTTAPIYGAVAEGALTAVTAIFRYAGWKKLLDDEAKALPLHKTWEQDIRETMGATLFVGALAMGVGNVVKGYGAWRSVYGTGLAERGAGGELAKKATVALRVTGALTAVVSGVMSAMDFVEVATSLQQKKWGLAFLQGLLGLTGITAASFGFWASFAAKGGATIVAGLSLTWWGVILTVVLVAVGAAAGQVKGDNFAQWLERCYWGTLGSGRYGDAATEQAGFQKAMTGA